MYIVFESVFDVSLSMARVPAVILQFAAVLVKEKGAVIRVPGESPLT